MAMNDHNERKFKQDTMTEYRIMAESKTGGEATAEVRKSIIPFDAAAESREQWPNPAELFLSAFAACILKNVERYSHILHIRYSRATISVRGWRRDIPPVMVRVEYELIIWSPEDDRKMSLLHRNIKKFGTIYNTVAASCKVKGTLLRLPVT